MRGKVMSLLSASLLGAGFLAGTAPATADPAVTGNATYFSGLGSLYGGCGLPQPALDSQNFVALNVFATPGDYGPHPRPIPPSMSTIMGAFDNGLNCGRFVQVTIGDLCTGTNDGAPGKAFCRNGKWTPDEYDGATLTMVVADSCADANAWCRDDPCHLDLALSSLDKFVLNGKPVTDLYPGHGNNRRISWQFVPAPSYSGDIAIGFIGSAQPYWPVIAVSHLPNGIHGVQYYSDGAWRPGTMDSDLGQDYVIAPTTTSPSPGTQYQVRVVDASDAPLANGRVYRFALPSSCAHGCGPAYTGVSYTTAASD